jgi:hypothetical protein
VASPTSATPPLVDASGGPTAGERVVPYYWRNSWWSHVAGGRHSTDYATSGPAEGADSYRRTIVFANGWRLVALALNSSLFGLPPMPQIRIGLAQVQGSATPRTGRGRRHTAACRFAGSCLTGRGCSRRSCSGQPRCNNLSNCSNSIRSEVACSRRWSRGSPRSDSSCVGYEISSQPVLALRTSSCAKGRSSVRDG